MLRKIMLVILLLAAMLLLTGCGEKGKYEKAEALAAEGKYYEAYEAFREIRNYEDAWQRAKEMEQAVYEAAETALKEGRYDEAETYAAHFAKNGRMEDVLSYTANAKNGTYVTGLQLTEDGKVSFTAAVAPETGDGTAKLLVELHVSANGRASGKVVTAEKSEKDTKEGFFIPEEYLKDGKYVVEDASIGSWLYDAEPQQFTIVDFKELSDEKLKTLQTLQMAKFPIAYEGIMQDGTKGAILTMWSCNNLEFRDIMKTFAGGTLRVKIVSADGKEIFFSQSTEIPADGEEQQKD